MKVFFFLSLSLHRSFHHRSIVTSTEFNFLFDVENVEIENVVRLTTFFLSTGVDSVNTVVSDKQRIIEMMRVASGLFETRGLPVPCCMAAGPDSSVTQRKENCRMCYGFSFFDYLIIFIYIDSGSEIIIIESLLATFDGSITFRGSWGNKYRKFA